MFWIQMASSILIDCLNVYYLSSQLLVDTTILTQIQIDCCSSPKIACSTTNVVSIDLSGLKLSGTFNTTALSSLTSLSSLVLSNNQLSGNLPNLPESLTNLKIDSNLFTGGLQLGANLLTVSANNNHLTSVSNLPANLQSIDISNNLIGGIISQLPATLTSFKASHNTFTGSLPSLPSNLIEFDASFNSLSGTFPGLPNSLTLLNLSNNKLTGSLPALPSNLLTLILSFNTLSGSFNLPATVTNCQLNDNAFSGSLALNKPVTLLIQNNKFTSLTISDLSVLSLCQVFNNPMNSDFLKGSVCTLDGKQLEKPTTTTTTSSAPSAATSSNTGGNTGYSGGDATNSNKDTTMALIAVGVVVFLLLAFGGTFMLVKRNKKRIPLTSVPVVQVPPVQPKYYNQPTLSNNTRMKSPLIVNKRTGFENQ
eukprot:NODE_385_length_8329_cov_0.434386.p1 type:complete len:423 gc:universal NODE_385_length_8329_cov_0.434386:507-1775(+)